MIRIICRQVDEAGAVNVGSPVSVTYKTFEVSIPEVEEWLAVKGKYQTREVIGTDSGYVHVERQP